MLKSEKPTIFVVATPIGNLRDISRRAIDTLKEVDLIAAEDTRHARKLLTAIGVKQKDVLAYHEHNEQEAAAKLIARISKEKISLALITDAGTPAISDPGYRLIRLANDEKIPVCPIPGPSAVTALLSASGLASNRFIFLGFLPRKSKALKDEMQRWPTYNATIVFFESLQRLAKTISTLAEIYPQAEVVIGRELTKLYEEFFRGTADEISKTLDETLMTRGEAAVAVHIPVDCETDSAEQDDQLDKQLLQLLRRGETFKDILRAYKDQAIPRKDLYRRLIELQKKV